MNKLPRMIRCWITGAEIPMRDALMFDRTTACAIRSALAQRLAVLDRLLVELAPRAGNGDHARILGVPPHAPRLIGEIMAQAYATATETTELFKPWPEVTRRSRQRWIDGVLGDARIAARFAGLGGDEWMRIAAVARQLRIGLKTAFSNELLRRHADACLALVYPGRDHGAARAMDLWLAGEEPTKLVTRAAILEEDRAAVLEAITARAAKAKLRLAAAADAASDTASDLDSDAEAVPEPTDAGDLIDVAAEPAIEDT